MDQIALADRRRHPSGGEPCRRPQTAVLAVFAALLRVVVACEPEADAIKVEICGDLSVPVELDIVRVSVLDNDRQERVSGIVELVACPGDRLTKLPVTLELPGVKGAVWIVLQGLKDCPPPDPQCLLGLRECEPQGTGCTEVIHAERRARTNDSGGADVLAVLDRRCMGITCPLGQTCEVPGDAAACDTNEDCPVGMYCFGDTANDGDPQGACGACIQAPFEVSRSACPGAAPAPDLDVVDDASSSYCPSSDDTQGGEVVSDTQGGDTQP